MLIIGSGQEAQYSKFSIFFNMKVRCVLPFLSGGGGGGGRVVRWCWVNFQCRGVLLMWIKVGQGPTALAVGAGGVV